jgi:hypothetical protein
LVIFKGFFVQVRGQIFSALRHLHREYDLYLPLDYIERRILELSMETCLTDVKSDGGKELYSLVVSNCFLQLKNVMVMIVILDDVLV